MLAEQPREQGQPGACISIFMPMDRSCAETQKDRLRLKNLLREAEKRLSASGWRTRQVKEMLEPAHRLLNDSYFWRHPGDGLALFISPFLLGHYCVPLDLDESLAIASHFDIKPLLPMLTGGGQFYVLAISQKQVRLLQGTRYKIDQVDLQSAPGSLAEALRFDDLEKQTQFRQVTSPVGRGRQAVFHGSGDKANNAKERLLRYFHQVDDGLRELLKNEQAPLVVAGVDYLFPIYVEANRYPYLLEEVIAGNPDELSAKDLHERAWEIVEPYFRQKQLEALERYRQFADSERASDKLEEILPAAYHGRVELLLTDPGQQVWGVFDEFDWEVVIHTTRKAGDEDLANLAVIETLSKGGTVYALEPDEMPGDTPLMAVYRY